MTSPPTHHLLTFIGKLRRRIILLRLMEGAGRGTLCAAVVAIAGASIGATRGTGGVVIPTAVLAVGALAGAAASYRPVRALHAALLADRALGLGELLSSAVACAPARDAWAAAVLARAEARCRNLSPGDVARGRLSGRGWGVVGLAVLATFTVGVLTAAPEHTHAARDPAVARAHPSTVVTIAQPSQLVRNRAPNHSTQRELGMGATTHDVDPARTDAAARASNLRPSAVDASGGSHAATNDASSPPPDASERAPDDSGGDAIRDGHASTGLGVDRGLREGTGTGADGTLASLRGGPPSSDAMPGKSALSPPDDATRAIEADAVPDAARDVVRAYFNRWGVEHTARR